MTDVLTDFAVVLLFVLIGGFFAASEMALVSLREGQIHRLAETDPRRGGRLARLVRNPNRFLAAVQVGVTIAQIVSAGFGASEIAPQITPGLMGLGMAESVADPVAFIAVTVLITYLSLVIGELTPKRIALQNAEGIALHVAGLIDWVARIARPFIWLLSVSTNALVRLLGGDPKASRERMTEEELRGLVARHTELTEAERALIDDVFAAGDRELREVMVPRTEVTFLDEDIPAFRAAQLTSGMPHSRYPVIRGSADDVVGFIHVRDLMDPAGTSRSMRIGDIVREVFRLPSSRRVIPALTDMRDSGQHLAIVVDEYGGTDGIVTLEDLVEELVGDIRDEYDTRAAHVPERPRESRAPRDVDGLTNLDDFAERTGIELPEGAYETVAGFVVFRLGRLPEVGDEVRARGHRFTVTELDGRRIARVLVSPVQGAGDRSPGDEAGSAE